MSQELQRWQPGCRQEDPLPSIVSSSSWRKMLWRNLRSGHFPNSLTKIPPRTIPAAPAGRVLRCCVKCKNRSMRCPHTSTPSSWRDANNLSYGWTLLRRFIISWKNLACFECDRSTASEKSCRRQQEAEKGAGTSEKKQLQERLTAD